MLSNHRHRRQPLPVVAARRQGGDQYGRYLPCNERTNKINSGAKKSADDDDEDDDDDEHALPSACISSIRNPDDPKHKRKFMLSHEGKLTVEEARAHHLSLPSKPNIHNIDNDEAERVALQKPIPPDITSIAQLKWHRTKTVPSPQSGNEAGEIMPSSSKKLKSREAILMPCFVLSREKAASYRRKMGTTNNEVNATVLVQYLSLQNPNQGEYKYVEEATLLPFGVEDGSSASFHDAYLQRYIAQEVKQSTGPKKPWDRPIEDTVKIMRIYLKRVFDTIWSMEWKSREQAKNELRDYYDDVDEDSSSKWGRTRKPAKKKQFKVLELNDDDDGEEDFDDTKIFECSDQDDADDMDDLDAPYTQAITFDPDDFRMDDEEISNEPIRPGDVIEYYSPIYVAGDARGLRQATVLAIDPKDSMPLVLSNGEGLPTNVKVKRIKVMSGDNLLDHPGIFRLISMFKLRKLGSATAADGIAMETARFGSIMKRNISKLKERAEVDGFAPMDLLVNIKGANDDSHSSTSTQTKRKASGSSSSRKVESRSMSFSSSSDSSSSDEEIAKIRSRRMLPKQTNSVSQRSFGSKDKVTAAMKRKENVGSFLMSESSSESDDSSSASISIIRASKERKVGKNPRDGLDLSLSSDDNSTVINLQPGWSNKKQENASSKLDSTLTPEPTTYPIQGLSKTISKSTAKKRLLPSSDLSSSEDSDSDVEMNILSKPFQFHNKNAATGMKSASGKLMHSSESINRRCELEEQQYDAKELPSHETFGWTKGSAGWKKTSIDASGFNFARHK